MKAAYFMKHGGPEVMQYGDVPDSVAAPGQVLVDVHAASVTGCAVRVPKITSYALSEAGAAHKANEGRDLRGKLVFKVR